MRVILDIFTSECAHRHTRMHSRTHAGTLAHVYMIYLYIILPCHTCARKYQYIMYNKERGLKYSRPFRDIDRFLSIFGEQRKCLEYHTSVRERDRKALGDWLNKLSLEVSNVCCNSNADFFKLFFYSRDWLEKLSVELMCVVIAVQRFFLLFFIILLFSRTGKNCSGVLLSLFVLVQGDIQIYVLIHNF